MAIGAQTAAPRFPGLEMVGIELELGGMGEVIAQAVALGKKIA